MSNEPSPPSPRPARASWLPGMFAGGVSGGLLCGAVAFLGHAIAPEYSGPNLILPSFIFLPVLTGLAAAFFWRQLQPTTGETTLRCLWLTLLEIAGAAVVMREGVICLILVFPLFYGLVLCGGLLGRVLFRKGPPGVQVSVLPLLVVLALAEPFTRTEQTGVVTDEILVRAPPAKVWPQITAFPAIPDPPRFWLFRLGLPYPMATTTAGDYLGADRRCIFSHGAVFKEAVSGLVPGRELTFDILEAPPDPELLGHLTLHRGQFLLRDNGDGTTTLTGSSWYTLHAQPLWYFDWWTHHIFRAVHLRVMADVKRRAEI